MKNKSRRKQVMAGTLLLTVASFVAKVLSAVYRIPFQNMVGNVGFYVYQQIYPIYGLGMTIALTGFPVFISKLVVDTANPHDQVALVYRIQLILLMICLGMFGLLQFGAQPLARGMADERLAPVIQSVSWMFLLIPFLSTWRGYFQGRFEMRPTAYSQVIEQIVRVSVILLTAYWSIHALVDPYKMGELAMLSAPLAGIGAAIVVAGWLKSQPLPASSRHLVNQGMLKKVILEGGTICLVTAVMLLLQLVDSFTIISGLKGLGISLGQAQNLKGIYDRSQTLVQLGLVLSTASTTAALPSLTVAYHRQQDLTFQHIAAASLRTNFALALAMSAGLFALMPQINRLLFSSSQLNLTISVYCLSIVLVAILFVDSMVLQSQSQYWPIMVAILVGLVFKMASNRLLISWFGIIGASYATIASLAVILIVVTILAGVQLLNLFSSRQVGQLGIILLVMVAIVHLVADGILSVGGIVWPRIEALLIVMICVPIGITIFFGGCKLLNVFTVREWLAIPLVSRFIKLKGEKSNEN
ncbi:sugar transporter [Lentilactobacillus fungorum]|uniref:Sugar transporter n=1 Tax=Lentilactobacillus fungorum TaxID=2201250 RepID=A0ABQ3VY94_9LACO|nr:oligosaccharide flippase family protein [Lentilactobacillus fungorum]GHP13156.1 sugar transporter [Lentilactobacillus fungorum]